MMGLFAAVVCGKGKAGSYLGVSRYNGGIRWYICGEGASPIR
ncbi:hypothetical protein [Alloprevotella tannerae]|nr:hypothetical protein [Alloprevotella tannerae]